MPQYKLTLLTADADEARSAAGLVGEAIMPAPHAVTLFEEGSDWRVEAYYLERPDAAGAAEALGAASARPLRLAVIEVPDENWVAISQAALPPVHAGRFTIHGSHDRGRVPRGPNAIEIDAGEAFGTAHHATTLGCLLALDRIAARGSPWRVLDLGCGSGVLAIAAARTFPHARVLASDIDPLAVEVARANIRINGVRHNCEAVRAVGLEAPVLRGSTYDLVLANILAGPLIGLSRGLARTVKVGGIAVLSGLLAPQAASVAAAYRAAGFAVAHHARIAGWSTLTLVRRPCLERRAAPRRGG